MPKMRTYTPGPIQTVPGIRHKPLDDHRDLYVGDADALAGAGVVPPELLPPPGAYSITWHPTQRPADLLKYRAPGLLHVVMLPSGKYRATLVVSAEEQRRRQRAAEESKAIVEAAQRLAAQRAAQREAKTQSAKQPSPPGAYWIQRRLAAVEALCRAARAGVVLKKGDSSKLHRAHEDLDAAVDGLADLRAEYNRQYGPDGMADLIALNGENFEQSYLKRAGR